MRGKTRIGPWEVSEGGAVYRPPRRRRAIALGALAVVFFVVLVLPSLAHFATDWLWYDEIHFQSVFRTSLIARALLFVGTALVAFAFIYGNVRWARRGVVDVPVRFVGQAGGAGVSVDVSRVISVVLLVGSVVVAFVTALAVAAQWMSALMFLHGARVGEVDPLFGRDIGFYLFRLPALDTALATLAGLTFAALVGAVAGHVTRGAIVLGPRSITIDRSGSRQLGVLLALMFLLFSAQLWFVDSASLLYSTSGRFVGASYADVHVLLAGIRVSAVAGILAAGLVIYGALRGRLPWFALIAAAGYVVVGIIGRGLAPAAEQQFVVAPNELARERPFLQRHIAATRRAWRLDSVVTRDLSGDVQLSMADIRANGPTIDNVRLWERDLLKQTLGQLQEIRTYYDFPSVNDDRYVIDGRYRQVHLAARELNSASLPTRNFINERMTFTHGMGVAMAPVNQVTAEGLPVLFIKDLPPASTISLKVTRPQIYFGQLTNSYVFVGTGQKEFDYPAENQNIYTNYRGSAGVPMGSVLRRALFAWELGSTDIMLSSYLTPDTRILYRRNVVERAQTALPFLQLDAEPYLVVTDSGTLKWIIDAYTSSTNWPYSQSVQDGTNYMRNSVKVVIDAYDGTVDAYLADPADPIVRTYAAIFGAIFKPLSAMPADLRAHLRYPGDLFRLQTSLYATYHMVEPDAFYHREDQWQYPAVEQGRPNANPFMRHIILRLPGEASPEFIYMTPFTPRGKDNLAAWMAARMDGANYGKLVAYQFPKQSLVYGPKQIANRINQDTEISQQLTLWDQRGSSVIRGELLVIPIRESLIYVQPLYLRAEGGTIPELKRVIVAHENRVAMAETLDAALAALFSGAAPAAPVTASVDSSARQPNVTADKTADLVREAGQHYDRAIAAQRAGDWATYGKEMEQLGRVLGQLRPRRP
jgi:uncharacterized membrane protein (UPF0182 family)